MLNDLNAIHDDIYAFTQGVGMKHFPGYIPDEMPSVLWDGEDVTESWKDFVELARSSGAAFLTVNTAQLDADDVELLTSELRRSRLSRADDLENARLLRAHSGQMGFIQLGFPHQGVMFVCEIMTEWYETYKALEEMADDLGGIMIDGPAEGGEEDER